MAEMPQTMAKTEGVTTFVTAHPLRDTALGEVHARPVRSIKAPATVLCFAFALEDGGHAADRRWFRGFCEAQGNTGPAPRARHHTLQYHNGTLIWEQHGEFTTYLWAGPAEEKAPFAFEPTNQPFGAGFRQPGPLMVAVRLELGRFDEEQTAQIMPLFDRSSLTMSQVENGAAEIATDFRQDRHGRTRVLVIDRGLEPYQAGALVQRIVEIEIYRIFALLGLPEAQRLWPEVGRIERRLHDLTGATRGSSGLASNRELLEQLTQLAADLETDAAASAYRFGASRAYYQLVGERLDALMEQPIAGYATWGDFLNRRLAPAMRTCMTLQDRQNNLSEKLARAATLLRTRIEVELQQQNRDLLESMNRRTRLQLRLQQTVEGLSVAAISYYIVGLVSYLLKGASEAGAPSNLQYIGTAVAVPLTVLGVWYLVRRLRRHHYNGEPPDA